MSIDTKTSRRGALAAGAKLLAGTVVGSVLAGAGSAAAGEAGGDFYGLSASTEGKCATCEFWGGVRKLSEGRETVLTQSLGWCNNPESMRAGQLTTPDTGPMKSWRKWQAIP